MEFREMIHRVKDICGDQSACTYCPIYDPDVSLCLFNVEPDVYNDEWFGKVERAVSLGKPRTRPIYPTWHEVLRDVAAGPVAGGHIIIDLDEEIPEKLAKRLAVKPTGEWRG